MITAKKKFHVLERPNGFTTGKVNTEMRVSVSCALIIYIQHWYHGCVTCQV